MIVAIVARHVADNLFFSFGFASARLQSLAWIAVALAIAPRDEPESGGPILTTNSAVMN
jgi:hypothetical protein